MSIIFYCKSVKLSFQFRHARDKQADMISGWLMKDKIRSPCLPKPNGASGRVGPSTSTNERDKTVYGTRTVSSIYIAPNFSTRVIFEGIFNDGKNALKRKDKQVFVRHPSSSPSETKSSHHQDSRSRTAAYNTVVSRDTDPKTSS